MTLLYRVGDTRALIRQVPDQSVNFIVTSPPFLAQRSYLDDDDPNKPLEIGMEESPATFIQELLDLTGEWGRVLTEDGSIAVELGDTYADSGGAGGDYNEGGSREGQPKYRAARGRTDTDVGRNKMGGDERPGGHHQGGDGWPMGKSMCLIPHLFAASLAYGRNILTGEPCPQWRVRNVICWARTNPTPGAQGDKYRKGTSYIIVACKSRTRYWNREEVDSDEGVPPLDWGEETWVMSGAGVPNSPVASGQTNHYAVYPEELPRRLIRSMCPPYGTVLDPFCGSGTTLAAAMHVGVNGIGFDLDKRNAQLARERVGMFLEVDE